MMSTNAGFEPLDVNGPRIDNYLERYKHYCRADAIKVEQKVSLLLSLIEADAHLPTTLRQCSHNDVEDKLMSLFDKKKHSDIVEIC